jgi:hypothetical protein
MLEQAEAKYDAIKALEATGDHNLVTVTGQEESVRVWIDSNSGDKQ